MMTYAGVPNWIRGRIANPLLVGSIPSSRFLENIKELSQ
jgi:hypothetical protein